MRREMRVGGFVDDMLTRGIIASGDKLGQVLNTVFYSVMGSQIVRSESSSAEKVVKLIPVRNMMLTNVIFLECVINIKKNRFLNSGHGRNRRCEAMIGEVFKNYNISYGGCNSANLEDVGAAM
ncbi:hypothetical protein CDAR_526461 [Caerostris darwini]|uniref:DNA-directed RNA polymerase n=1 Tax=Caerostris darwini TaxID=1538125 RepID=A0AAV4T503_9ARAC|nr:hypothetical protein CDAR_526461 [Caerostris darwini]